MEVSSRIHRRGPGRGSEGRAPRSWWSFYNKNLSCGVKMQNDVKFCLKFVRTHITVSHANTAQSTELFYHMKQCVLATLKTDDLVFWTLRFFISGLHTFLL